MLGNDPKCLIMIAIACVLLYLAIVKKFEPLLLLPIAFGMLLTNLPGAGMYHSELFAGGHVHWDLFVDNAGLIDYLYLGVKLGIYPCLIFVGVGAMTDFAPLIANPKSLLLGAAAQVGIFVTFWGMGQFFDFTGAEAASTGIIGGRSYRNFLNFQIGSSFIRPHRRCGIFVHGVGTRYSAADYETSDHQEGTSD